MALAAKRLLWIVYAVLVRRQSCVMMLQEQQGEGCHMWGTLLVNKVRGRLPWFNPLLSWTRLQPAFALLQKWAEAVVPDGVCRPHPLELLQVSSGCKF